MDVAEKQNTSAEPNPEDSTHPSHENGEPPKEEIKTEAPSEDK